MAKDSVKAGSQHSETTQQSQPEVAASAPAAAAADSGDSRHVKLTLNAEAAKAYGKTVGTIVNRVDFMRDLFKSQNFTRGEIRKLVNATKSHGTKDIAYQIVFAATKGMKGKKSQTEVAATEGASAPVGEVKSPDTSAP